MDLHGEHCQTVGGMLLQHLGRVPKRNEVCRIDGVSFEVLRADSRRLYTLLVTPASSAATIEAASNAE
jgi:magnesium and cobalt transporter